MKDFTANNARGAIATSHGSLQNKITRVSLPPLPPPPPLYTHAQKQPPIHCISNMYKQVPCVNCVDDDNGLRSLYNGAAKKKKNEEKVMLKQTSTAVSPMTQATTQQRKKLLPAPVHRTCQNALLVGLEEA